MNDFAPQAQPFSMAVAKNQIDQDILEAALLTNSAIDAAKRILLQNRVQNFQAADVVQVARLIVENSNGAGEL